MIIVMPMPRPRELDDETWLRTHYLDKGQPATQIAIELGCSPTTVIRAIERYGIRVRTRENYSYYSYPELKDEQLMRSLYLDEGLGSTQIAEMIGCSKGAVLKNLHAHGVQIRGRKGSLLIRSDRPQQLDDERWLREHYVDQQMTCAQIGAMIGVSQQAVRYALVKHEIPRRSGREAVRLRSFASLPDSTSKRLKDERWLRIMYVERGLPPKHIAQLIGCSDSFVISSLRHHGIPIRSIREAQRARFGMSAETQERLDDGDWLREAYDSQRRPAEVIASELECSINSVIRALKRHKIRVRSWSEAGVVQARAAHAGYDANRRRRLANLAKDAGEVGKAYSAVIRLLGQLDRVPHVSREASRLEREAMDGLYRAQDALAQRLLLGQGDGQKRERQPA